MSPPRKRFSQHFLRDHLVLDAMVEAIAPQVGQALIEIGPGRGALTLPLLEAAGRLDAIELDRDLIPRLQRMRGLVVHEADALQVDFAALGLSPPLRIVGNLPYNISTPLLFHLLDQLELIEDMHFLLQKEVVERMAAVVGTSAYGRLSVMLQSRCVVEPLFDVGPEVFDPPPKVESSFVRLHPHPTPPFAIEHPAYFSQVVRAAFSQRRKTLRNALRQTLSREAIEAAGVAPETRPETLTPAQFAALGRALAQEHRSI